MKFSDFNEKILIDEKNQTLMIYLQMDLRNHSV